MPRAEDEIRLSDGRRLAFCDNGAPQGALVSFHGWPGSRLDFAAMLLPLVPG